MSDEATSPLPVLQVRCRGCDNIPRPGVTRLEGDEVGIHVLDERCIQCGGRLQELYRRRINGRRRWS